MCKQRPERNREWDDSVCVCECIIYPSDGWLIGRFAQRGNGHSPCAAWCSASWAMYLGRGANHASQAAEPAQCCHPASCHARQPARQRNQTSTARAQRQPLTNTRKANSMKHRREKERRQHGRKVCLKLHTAQRRLPGRLTREGGLYKGCIQNKEPVQTGHY